MTDLDEVIDKGRQSVAMMKVVGGSAFASFLEDFIADVARASEPWRRWLSEEDANTKSGHSIKWLRAKGPFWAALDPPMARRDGRRWWFRDAVVPQRQHVSAAREDAKRQARRDAA